DRVDAVANAGGGGAVGKDVPEVRVAGAAADLDAAHAVGQVFELADVRTVCFAEEARPAAARVVLLLRGEEHIAAAHAAVRALALFVGVLAREGGLRGALAGDQVLGIGELGAKLGVTAVVGQVLRAHGASLAACAPWCRSLAARSLALTPSPQATYLLLMAKRDGAMVMAVFGLLVQVACVGGAEDLTGDGVAGGLW